MHLDLESKARRLAKRAPLVARKSRWRKYSIDNHGEFMLVDPATNASQAGFRYDMSAEEVIRYCSDPA